jgi:hypothetical protein
LPLTRKLLNQGVLVIKVKSNFMVVTMTWLTVAKYLCHKWQRICSVCRNHHPVLSSFMTFHRFCNRSNTTVVTSGAGTTYFSGARECTPVFCLLSDPRVVHVVNFHVFTFVVPCCDVRYNFRVKKYVMFVLTPLCFVGDSCFICLYLCKLVSNTIYISDDVRVV